MLDGRVLEASQVEYKPFGKPPLQRELARFTFKALDGTMTDVFIHLIAYQLVTLSGTGVSVLD